MDIQFLLLLILVQISNSLCITPNHILYDFIKNENLGLDYILRNVADTVEPPKADKFEVKFLNEEQTNLYKVIGCKHKKNAGFSIDNKF